MKMLIESFGKNPVLTMVLLAWTMVWKGIALWKAGGLRQKWWFIVFLVLNTLGILEIIYIFFISKNYKVEVIEK